MRQIGQRIRRARLVAGFSQEDLGDLQSVTRAAVSLWEKDRSKPDEKRLIELAAMLKVAPDYLLHGKGRPPIRKKLPRTQIAHMERLLAAGLPFGRFDHMIKDHASMLIRDGHFDDVIKRRAAAIGQ